MNPADLPFDAESMLAGLRPWVECESPTWDAPAVNRMMDLVTRELVLAGASVERIPGRMGFGDCVRARFPHARRDEPGILVLGHFDTVHPVGTLAHLRFRQDGERAWGPGICDMKGGNFIALQAIRALVAARGRPAVADHGAVHQRRGGRQSVHAGSDRGGGRAPEVCAGAGTGAS